MFAGAQIGSHRVPQAEKVEGEEGKEANARLQVREEAQGIRSLADHAPPDQAADAHPAEDDGQHRAERIDGCALVEQEHASPDDLACQGNEPARPGRHQDHSADDDRVVRARAAFRRGMRPRVPA